MGLVFFFVDFTLKRHIKRTTLKIRVWNLCHSDKQIEPVVKVRSFFTFFSHLLKSIPPPPSPPTTPLVWPSRPVVILSYFASHEVLITFFTGLHTQHSTHKQGHVMEMYSHESCVDTWTYFGKCYCCVA